MCLGCTAEALGHTTPLVTELPGATQEVWDATWTYVNHCESIVYIGEEICNAIKMETLAKATNKQ